MNNIYYLLILVVVILMCIPKYEPFISNVTATADPIYKQYVYSLGSH